MRAGSCPKGGPREGAGWPGVGKQKRAGGRSEGILVSQDTVWGQVDGRVPLEREAGDLAPLPGSVADFLWGLRRAVLFTPPMSFLEYGVQ